jgi:acyl carrier protein
VSAPYAVPRTELEQRLAVLWAKRLRIEPIGRHDDFFELGGDSLAASGLLVDIAAATSVEVSARTLFLQPSIAELAVAIEATGIEPAAGALR